MPKQANGHGTVAFSDAFIDRLNKYQPKTDRQKLAKFRIHNSFKLINQVCISALRGWVMLCYVKKKINQYCDLKLCLH